VDKGVTAEVYPSKKTKIFFNGKRILFPTVEAILTKPTKVLLKSDLPLGAGFGLSGASAFATALATRNKTKLECAKIAHRAEVKNKTGLGDVVNQYYGGFLVKRVSSAKFQVQRIPIKNIPLYCISYGKLLTSSILQNEKLIKRINIAADSALEKINRKMKLAEILTVAKKFAIESGLLTSKRVIHLIENVENRGGHASMIMLGEGVVSDIPFEGAIKLMVSG